jgi:Flp pilus assembly protein TadG
MHRPNRNRPAIGPTPTAGSACATQSSMTPRPRRRRTRGQSLVEFAVILPVFLLILSGVLDFGFLLYGRINAINAIKESAQCGATGACTVDSAGNAVTWSTMVGAARTVATNDGLSVSPTFGCIKATSASAACPSAGSLGGTSMQTLANGQDAVQATATYQYQTFFPLLFGAKINVSVSTEMVVYPPPPPN